MRSVDQAIDRHYSDLRRYAHALARDRNQAEELVQDCMIRALSRPHLWTNVRDPRAYLLTILHNAYVDEVQIRRRRRLHQSIEEIQPVPSRPATQLAALELRDVARGLRQLPQDQRSTLTCVGLDGLSYQETAERLGVPIGTVMSRIARARGALRQFLDGAERGAVDPAA